MSTQTGMLFSLTTDEISATLAAFAVYVPDVARRIRAARLAGQTERVTFLSNEYAAADRLAQRLQEGDGVPIEGCLACYSPRCTKCKLCHECDDPEFICPADGEGRDRGPASLTATESDLVAQLALLDRVAGGFFEDDEKEVDPAEGASNFYSELIAALREHGSVTVRLV